MKLYIRDDPTELVGVCEACGFELLFNTFDVGDGVDYYNTTEIVNMWMNHQLNDCEPGVIDNPGGIG